VLNSICTLKTKNTEKYEQVICSLRTGKEEEKMKKMGFMVFLSLLVILMLGGVGAQQKKETVTVYHVALTDSDNYNYGVNFFVDSTVNGRVYVTATITSQENVNGDVISGPALLRPNEKRFRVGSFICKDQSKAWSVEIDVKWQHAD